MGLRAIPAQRFLASHARGLGVVFVFKQPHLPEDMAPIDPIVVFSPAMYLPAVISKAEALAKFVFGSADALGVRRAVHDMGVLGVEADVMSIDGSPEGLLRATLLARASEQVFELGEFALSRRQEIDLARVTSYYRGDGALAIRGEEDDILSADTADYRWKP